LRSALPSYSEACSKQSGFTYFPALKKESVDSSGTSINVTRRHIPEAFSDSAVRISNPIRLSAAVPISVGLSVSPHLIGTVSKPHLIGTVSKPHLIGTVSKPHVSGTVSKSPCQWDCQ
jgi:hypothetical protein